jgi:ADP-dependent NAD(P)H-hydrate dehydratase / NAD(P)H-hydrate epimerase
MKPNMQPLLSAAQMQRADSHTIDSIGIPDAVLMEHAALAVVKILTNRFQKNFPHSYGTIVSGFGNNGGDAVAAARVLFQSGHRNFSLFICKSEKRSRALLAQMEILRRLNIPWEETDGGKTFEDSLKKSDWAIDGLFGTGLSRAIEGIPAVLIDKMNALNKWTLAIDIPSGLSADTGTCLGPTIKASATVSLGFLKRGLVTGEAADYVGNVQNFEIQIPRTVIDGLKVSDFLFVPTSSSLPERKRVSHKGDFGHVFVWCGTKTTEGAAAMSALAALRSGSGLVTLWGEPSNVESIRNRLPVEVMTKDYDKSLFEKEGMVGVFGPGMGKTNAHWEYLKLALKSNWILVLDGDALTLISEHSKEAQELISKRKVLTCLTPHPKEASRLLACTVAQIQGDRFAKNRELSECFKCFSVLKGKGTLVTGYRTNSLVVTSGDTGLAKGGSGDVLSGIVGSLLGQPGDPLIKIATAVYLHGRASELVSQRFGTERSSIASDIISQIPESFKEIE